MLIGLPDLAKERKLSKIVIHRRHKHNNLFAHVQLQNSGNKALKKKQHNSDIKRDKLVEFRRIILSGKPR